MITFSTTQAQTLLARIKRAIDEGAIKTWSYDRDGDFTHTPIQWLNEAWMRPSVTASGLQCNFVGPNNRRASREVYAVYQGRFQEMMIAHFFLYWTVATCTPSPQGSDSAIAA